MDKGRSTEKEFSWAMNYKQFVKVRDDPVGISILEKIDG